MGKVTRVSRPAPQVELYAKAAAGSVLPGQLWGGGTELPEQTLERLVRPDRSEVAAYNEVCGFATTDVLPVTYPHVLGFPLSMQLMTGRSFPMPVLGMIHVGNTITVHRPVPADAELRVRVHAEGPYRHRRGAEVDLITEVSDGSGLLWHESSSYLAKGSKLAADLEPRPPLDWPVPPANAHVREARIGGDIGRRYGSVSGDRNPIHLHAVTARAFGFKRAIAHGMWTLANSLAVAGMPFDPPYQVSAAWRKPVLLPANVRLLTSTEDEELRVWLTGPTSDTVHVVATVQRVQRSDVA